jgi:hypothetical protein
MGATPILCMLIWIIAQLSAISSTFAPNPGLIIVMLLGCCVAGFLFYQVSISLGEVLNTTPVRMAEGVLRIRHERGYRSSRVYYVIDGQSFELSGTMLRRQAYHKKTPTL